jgi:hypothetical protein
VVYTTGSGVTVVVTVEVPQVVKVWLTVWHEVRVLVGIVASAVCPGRCLVIHVSVLAMYVSRSLRALGAACVMETMAAAATRSDLRSMIVVDGMKKGERGKEGRRT